MRHTLGPGAPTISRSVMAKRRTAWDRARTAGTPILAAVFVTALFLLPLATFAAHPTEPPSGGGRGVVLARTSSGPANDFVNVSATTMFAFVPGTFSVGAGDQVHLVVTQLANFLHTFVLSSVANFSLPSGATAATVNAFFNQHTPIVNLSLGSTVGAKYFANFTAPALGTYEYVCIVSGHFQAGMLGTMTVTASGSGTSSGSSSLPILWIGVAVVVIAAVAGLVYGLSRRRRPSPPPGPGTAG